MPQREAQALKHTGADSQTELHEAGDRTARAGSTRTDGLASAV